ncbi:ligand-binding sensor domain-containing protein [Pleionea sediminis]|uniref:ligand-binding sensor domain-containing protein n=1 Tax=Pleionea sediminis TaxID=2569479 RepID=UPI001186C992|nr:ligand-binding sensor domain-containing diguanylate cyclase [Pleionea sediminis]
MSVIRRLFASAILITFTVCSQLVTGISYQMQVIGVEDGLPQSTVRAIAQDKYGFLYFATDEGISRYDGVSHQNLNNRKFDKRSLFSFSKICINDGILWATSLDGGVLRYDIEQNEGFQISLNDISGGRGGRQVISCDVDASGQVWFISELGLFHLITSNDLSTYTSKFYFLSEREAPDDEVTDFIIDSDNQIFVATTSGVKGFAQGQYYEIPKLTTSEPVNRIFQDQKSRFWILLKDSVRVYKKHPQGWREVESPSLSELNSKIKKHKLNSIDETHNGGVWITSDTGGAWSYQYENEKIANFSPSSDYFKIPDEHVVSIFQSEDGIIWIGTWLNGVIKLTPNVNGLEVFSKFELKDNKVLEEPSIRAIYQDPSGQIWVGTDGSGILTGNEISEEMRLIDRESDFKNPLLSNFIRVFYTDKNGNLLVGTEKGLVRFSEESGFNYFSDDMNIALQPGELVRAIIEDDMGRLWVGTYDKGLFWWSETENVFKQYKLNPSRSIERISTLMKDKQGTLWVATDDSGVHVIQPSNMSKVSHYHGGLDERLHTPSNSIWSLYQENDTTMWMGSYGRGVAKLNLTSGVFQYYTSEDGLPNDVIYSIMDDKYGWLWSTTNRGLTRYIPEQQQYITYKKTHGLPHNEFNSGAYFKSKDGKFYFGSLKGMVVIDPGKISRKVANHRVYLNSLRINGERVDTSTENYKLKGPVYRLENLRVSENYDRIEFSLTTNDFVAPDKNSFIYRLVGFQDKWQTTEHDLRRISFSSLPAGDYRLEVKAKNSFGAWSHDTLVIPIELVPPWWLTGWAYVLYVVLLFSLIWGSVEGWTRYQKRNKEMLERLHYLVKHRTQELKSKNEQLEGVNRELKIANEKLEKVSMTDALTGLGNRRLLYHYLERDIGNVNRAYISLNSDFDNLEEVQKHDLLFFIIDIDNFKKINDTYGHAVGDKILIEITNVASKVIRKGDYIVRYGGEEFLFVMRDTQRSEGPIIAERILQAFMEHKFPISRELTLNLTCSVGFAPYPFSSYDASQMLPEQIIQIADLCLYCAKQSGKNCWVGLEGVYGEKEVSISEVMKSSLALIESGLVKLHSSRNKSELNWSPKSE